MGSKGHNPFGHLLTLLLIHIPESAIFQTRRPNASLCGEYALIPLAYFLNGLVTIQRRYTLESLSGVLTCWLRMGLGKRRDVSGKKEWLSAR